MYKDEKKTTMEAGCFHENTSPVLVPISLSPGDKPALRKAVALADELHAEILLVHVITPFYLINAGVIPMVWPIRYTPEQDGEDAKAGILKMAEELIPSHITWKLRLLEGTLPERLLHVIKEEHPVMLILSTRHRSLVSRLLTPSLAHRLSKLAPCPSLVMACPANASGR